MNMLMEAQITAKAHGTESDLQRCLSIHERFNAKLKQFEDTREKNPPTGENNIVIHAPYMRLTCLAAQTQGMSKFTAAMIKDLASPDEVWQMWVMYEERFNFQADPEGEARLQAKILDLTTHGSTGSLNVQDVGSDLGVELERQYTHHDLQTGFGLGSNWFGFNESIYSHSNDEDIPESMPLVFQWHQKVRVDVVFV